jgi:C4-dicarboxylate transporter DctM subunit
VSPELVGIIGLAVLAVLLFSKIWIGAIMFVVGVVGYACIGGWDSALVLAGRVPYSTIADYGLMALPMFILMGIVVANTGVSGDLFKTAYKWLGQFRGGLASASVASCGMFAAICGDSMATAVTMGKVAIPEMKKYNYDPALASGSIAAGGTLGILIPPSLGFILYGLLTQQSIGKLFMAGIIPGVLEIVFYVATIYILCRFNPQLGPPGPRTGLKEKVVSLKGTWAMLALFSLVMGGIYMGIFTTTEAGAIGAFGAIVISLIGRKLTWGNFRASIMETAQITGMLVFIIVGAFLLMRFIAISNLPTALSEFIAGLAVSRYVVLAAFIIFYIIMGCFFDVIAIIILTIPIVYPVIVGLGFDPIWLGVIMVRVAEIGLVTPPFGLNLFILSQVTEVPLGTVFRGVIPFLVADCLHVTLLIAVPALSLYLPYAGKAI